jgi:hypothetical protein
MSLFSLIYAKTQNAPEGALRSGSLKTLNHRPLLWHVFAHATLIFAYYLA